MTTTSQTDHASESDSHLWGLVDRGNASAFEVLVRRYQPLVCAVAYSTCGDLALSEDVAQETFWAAWRQRSSLEQPDRLRAWLCGIARNLAKNARRKATRPAESAEAQGRLSELSADEPGPVEEVVSREEESLVWEALGRIPEAYREPLILFYREDQSVAEVASALALSEDAVRQRLSRGRGMLRTQVTDVVERGLRRSRPGRRFTATVMAGVAAHTAGGKAALAGVGAGAGKAVAVAAGIGMVGGLLGTLGGLLGGWLGAWIPAQAAPTRREREAVLRSGRRVLLVSLGFIAGLLGMIRAFAGTTTYVIAWGGGMVAFWAYLAVECARLARKVQRIRAESGPDDAPNETALRAGWTALGARVGDRVYRSRSSFLGFPLVDVNLSAPTPPPAGKAPDRVRRVARGWVAVGDDAHGLLLAIGSTARGLIAMGGRAIGVVSVGGLALGVVGVGGLGAGVYALGGGAIGWRAAGGIAAAWDVASGGGAFARRAAVGGVAIARDYAVGGDARARHANDQAARTFLLQHPFTRFAVGALGRRPMLANLAGPGAASASSPTPGRFQLDNCLTVRVRPIQGAKNVALLVLYKVGGDHDPQGRSGLAHLVEHLYVTAAAGAAQARTSEAFFQRYPAGCNAQTGDRYTVVAAVFPKGDLETELTEAAARMSELRLTDDDLEREKPRLLDELSNMFGRLPNLGALNQARERIRPTPRGGRKGGLPAHVAALTLDDVQSHWTRYYKPRNAILVLAGAVDEAEARRAVSARFAKLAPGEVATPPGEPGSPKAGTMKESTVESRLGRTAAACLAYAAPEPGSELYAPFLVLASRFWAASAPPSAGSGTAGNPSVYFPLLDDPAVLGVSAPAKPGESAPQAVARLESFVAETIAPRLRDDERTAARQTFALLLGTAEVPDFALAQNPYGAAFSLARREQLGIDPDKLNRAFDALTERDLRRAADLFSPARRAGAFLSPAP